MNKSDTMWNWSFNTPCKSLKGILVLFEEEKSYVKDTSKFYNPKIQKVFVTIEGKPNQLYSQGMRSFEQYDEACKYFAEAKLANEVQAQGQRSRSDHSDLGRTKSLAIYGQSAAFKEFWSDQ